MPFNLPDKLGGQANYKWQTAVLRSKKNYFLLQVSHRSLSGIGSNLRKGHIKDFTPKIRPTTIVFQIHKWRKHCGRFTEIVPLKINDSYRYHGRGERRGPGGEAPGRFSAPRFFHFREAPFMI